jgi:hypothetical protein
MLKEWKNLLCPFDTSMTNAFEMFNLFLPTITFDEIEEERGYK